MAAIGVSTATLVLLAGSPALADGGVTQVRCEEGERSPGCTAEAGSREVVESSESSDVQPVGHSGGGGRKTCESVRGETVPCYDPELGWMATDGCYYQQTSYTPTSPQAARQLGKTGSGPGAWFTFTCPGLPGTGGGITWLPTPPEGGPSVSPVVLARRARERMDLPSPVIHSSPSPGQPQLVRLPTWLWIDSGAWGQRDETASVPGVSVTVTATPTTVTWRMGDGSTVVCHGRGTPYQPSGDPARPSPTCGHTYTRSSAGEPSDAYQVTATIRWQIRWSGGGQQGSLPALTSSSSTALRVAESQALVVGSRAES